MSQPPLDYEFGKRKHLRNQPTREESVALMAARDLIFKGDTEQGLAELDLLAANTADDRIKAKILVLVGESESRLARYPEAIEVYSRAATLARGVSAHDELVKSMLGIVRSHLLLMQPLEARVVAVDLLDEVIVLNQDFEGLLLLTPEEIEGQQTPQVVPARPPRTPVVLTKIAGAFPKKARSQGNEGACKRDTVSILDHRMNRSVRRDRIKRDHCAKDQHRESC